MASYFLHHETVGCQTSTKQHPHLYIYFLFGSRLWPLHYLWIRKKKIDDIKHRIWHMMIVSVRTCMLSVCEWWTSFRHFSRCLRTASAAASCNLLRCHSVKRSKITLQINEWSVFKKNTKKKHLMQKEEVLRAHAFNLTAYLLSETTSKLYEIFNLHCINIRDCTFLTRAVASRF